MEKKSLVKFEDVFFEINDLIWLTILWKISPRDIPELFNDNCSYQINDIEFYSTSALITFSFSAQKFIGSLFCLARYLLMFELSSRASKKGREWKLFGKSKCSAHLCWDFERFNSETQTLSWLFEAFVYCFLFFQT